MRTGHSKLSSTPGRPVQRLKRTRGFRPAEPVAAAVGTLLCSALLAAALPGVASAATAVQLNTATPFAILAGSAVTDVPTSSITGDVGLSPSAGSFIGLTQAEVTGGIYAVDASGPTGSINNPGLVNQAKTDLTTAYVSAAGDLPTTTFATGDNQLGGQTLTPGVYAFGHAATANLTAASPLVLNGNGDVNAVWVFQASSDLVTGSNSVVQLINGAQACNVFWVVGSSATLNSSSTFVGTLMALTSASLLTGATVQGRVLARNGAVTLQANTITTPSTCLTSSPPTTTTTTTAPTATTTATTPTGTPGPTGASPASPGPGGAGSPTGFSGSGGSAAGATPSATSSAAIVPSGAPGTGGGGAARGSSGALTGIGILSLTGAAAAMAAVARRRRYGATES